MRKIIKNVIFGIFLVVVIVGTSQLVSGNKNEVKVIEIDPEDNNDVASNIEDKKKDKDKEKDNKEIEDKKNDENNIVENQEQEEELEEVWVVDQEYVPPVTEDRWVVDQEAWTEEVPIYEEQYSWWVYNGESGEEEIYYSYDEAVGRYNELISLGIDTDWGEDSEGEVQVGVDTIEHEEQGHWETIIIQEEIPEEGHWEYR